MKFRRILFCACLAITAQVSTSPSLNGLATYPQSCPRGRIEAVSETCCGSECTFNGSVTGWPAAYDPVVMWTVSAGKITSGQGTWSIKVDVSETCKKPITVTMKVTGEELPKVCEIEEVYTTRPCP